MTDATVKCRECGEAATLGALDDLNGTAGDVTVTIHHMPARVCPQDHRRLAYPEFAARLMDYLGDPEKVGLPTAEKKGWFRRRAYCGGCHRELDGEPDVRTVSLGVRLDPDADFEVDFRLPLCTCPHCGLEQTTDVKLYDSHVPLAVVQALGAGHVSPE